MARMHSGRRGSSGSDRPTADEPPEWSEVDADAIEERVVELAEKGNDPSQIGLKLRDEGVQGTPVPDVKLATGKKVTEILEEHDAAPDLPEDLRNLMVRAVARASSWSRSMRSAATFTTAASRRRRLGVP